MIADAAARDSGNTASDHETIQALLAEFENPKDHNREHSRYSERRPFRRAITGVPIYRGASAQQELGLYSAM